MDYRFLPEPNLPPLAIEPAWVERAEQRAQANLIHVHYIEEHGFTPLFAIGAMKSKKLGHFVQTYLAHGQLVDFQQLSPWLIELEYLCGKLAIAYPPSDAALIRYFAELVQLECQGKLTKLVGIDLLREFALQKGLSTKQVELIELIEQRRLWRITDHEEIQAILSAVLAEQRNDFLEKLREQRRVTEKRNKQFAKLKRKIIDKSDKRIHPDDVEAAIWNWIDVNHTDW